MHVLFITESRFDKTFFGDGSTRYRCFNVAEAIIASGHRATVASIAEVTPGSLSRYDVVSVLRPRASRRLSRIVKQARALGLHLVADFDDLIFDISAAAESPLVLNGFADTHTVARGFRRFAKACAWFDEITVSTGVLVDAAQKCFPSKPVYQLSNGLSPRWLQSAGRDLARVDESTAREILSYLPGTRSHDADFSMVNSGVAAWLAEKPQRELLIVGELDIDKAGFSDRQLRQEPLVPFFSLPEKFQQAHATLAPLLGNTFNRAKSHIKFLESAAFGVPVVASPNPDICQHDGVKGLFVVNNVEQWQASISAAVSFYKTPGAREQLMTYVREHWTATETSRETVLRWQNPGQAVSGFPNIVNRKILGDARSFYPALRPVPYYYTLNGWQTSKPTNVLVYESPEDNRFQSIDLQLLETQVKSTGGAEDQWLVLIADQHTGPAAKTLLQQLKVWRPAARHIEMVRARTNADRCALLYQCDELIWLTPERYPAEPLSERTTTARERMLIATDRWARKWRKFRESPGRFIADSRLVKTMRAPVALSGQ